MIPNKKKWLRRERGSKLSKNGSAVISGGEWRSPTCKITHALQQQDSFHSLTSKLLSSLSLCLLKRKSKKTWSLVVGWDSVCMMRKEKESEVESAEGGGEDQAAIERAFEEMEVPPWQNQITFRAMLTSLVLSIVFNVIVCKLNLSTGVIPSLNVAAGLLGFATVKAWTVVIEKCGLLKQPFTRQENTVIQTCVVASSGIAFSSTPPLSFYIINFINWYTYIYTNSKVYTFDWNAVFGLIKFEITLINSSVNFLLSQINKVLLDLLFWRWDSKLSIGDESNNSISSWNRKQSNKREAALSWMDDCFRICCQLRWPFLHCAAKKGLFCSYIKYHKFLEKIYCCCFNCYQNLN